MGEERSGEDLADLVLAGNRRALARAITLVESQRRDHRDRAERLLERVMQAGRSSLRLGISGPPGVGKSTFIETFGLMALAQGRRLAVLAVDPSSRLSGGSILGDKTRMTDLSRRPEAFIRPSPSGHNLGGVARRTREAILLCEGAGYDLVLVETVGVGQSETMVAEMTDMFMLLQLPAGGDDLQGIKRGIMELADLVVINKADGDLLATARRTGADYAHALRLMHPRMPGWTPPVLLASALTDTGIDAVWQAILDYDALIDKDGRRGLRRREQARHWLWQELSDTLLDRLRQAPGLARSLADLEARVLAGRITPGMAVRRLLADILPE